VNKRYAKQLGKARHGGHHPPVDRLLPVARFGDVAVGNLTATEERRAQDFVALEIAGTRADRHGAGVAADCVAG
jgi:hypothetical protein